MMLFETEARRKERRLTWCFFIIKTVEYFWKLLVWFLNEHKEKARATRTNTRHLNPSPWKCYSLYWRMRHELISSEEGEGGEVRAKATA
jgi:hypothetical protein